MKLIIIRVYSLIRYFARDYFLMEYISADMLFWQSTHSMRKGESRRKEGGKGGGKVENREKNKNSFSPYLSLPPLTCTGNHFTSADHLLVDHMLDRRWLHDCKEGRGMLSTFLSLLCPSGANATQIISREAGLETQKLDFIFCSHFIPEIFFFCQNQSVISSLVFSECRMLACYFFNFFFFFLIVHYL